MKIERDLFAREQRLLQESCLDNSVTDEAVHPVFVRGWEALRSFLCDLGCHQAERLVLKLEDGFRGFLDEVEEVGE